ncbi:MAG: Crp/Fnr family transcriptional regulator [Mucilaginibacter sp.]|nr:Crp/Fnr family transcriptional regulator [Mucilaginibacter sp.]
MMIKKASLILFFIANVLFVAAQAKRVLIFSKTGKYHHESIPNGIKAIRKLGRENHFEVDTTTDSTYFTESKLKKYAAIIFLNTSGNVLDTVGKTEFKRYIEAGGGYMGIHCASSTEKSWTWYGQLVGAVFSNHPEPQGGVVNVVDHENPAVRQLPSHWSWKDEWYNFKLVPVNVHVLLTANEFSYKGGTNGAYHPLAWYHDFDGGRAFYTALGHFPEAYTDPLFVQHILAGIQYAMGNNIKLDYAKVTTVRIKKD